VLSHLTRHRGRTGLLLHLMLAMIALMGLILLARSNAFLVAFGRNYDFLLSPLGIAFGMGLILYARNIRRQLWDPNPFRRERILPAANPQWLQQAVSIVALLVIAMNLLWSFGAYADASGRTWAVQIVSNLEKQNHVIVSSLKRLQIEAPGVEETALQRGDSSYHFRYTGLILLTEANGQYFLLPSKWSEANPITIALPQSEELRVDFIPGKE
jgi:hypothetical protein